MNLCRAEEHLPGEHDQADHGNGSVGSSDSGGSSKPKKKIIEQGTGYNIETEPDPNVTSINGKPMVPRHGNWQAEKVVSKHRPDMEKVSQIAYAIEEKNSGVDVDGKPLTKKRIRALNQNIQTYYTLLKNNAYSTPEEISKAFSILGVDDNYIQSLKD